MSALADFSRAIGAIWRWWRREMAAVLAPVLPPAPVLEATPEQGALRLTLRRGRERGESAQTLIGEVPFDPDAPKSAAPAIRALLRQGRGRYTRVEVAPPEGRALSRTVRLPLAARGSLEETLGYDIDRQTPFPREAIYFGARETAIDRQAGEVTARLDVARRSDIAPLAAALEAAGLAVDAARLDPDGPNLLPGEARRQPAPVLKGALGVLVAANLALGALALYAPVKNALADEKTARSEAESARIAAQKVRTVRDRTAALAARENALIDRRNARASALAILTEAARLLPDSAYLTAATLDGARLSITGYAEKATPLLALVEESPLFTGASFAQPVFLDGRMKAEKFALTALVAGRTDEARP